MNKNTYEIIKKYLDSNEWKYDCFEEDGVILSKINYKGVIGTVRLAIDVSDEYYKVYSIFNSTVESKYYNEIAEFLHRANYGLNDGNFELDYEDGEIRYKTYVRTDKTDLDIDAVERSIFIGLAMIKRYGSGIIKIMLGEITPEKCIREIENHSFDEEDDA